MAVDMRYVGHPDQAARVTRSVLAAGRADGLRVADVDTGGGLRYSVLEGRGMDLYGLSYRGVNCSFLGKPGLTHASYFSSRQGEFFRTFGAGMLYTCGLLNIGSPRQGDFETMPQHGRIANTPAEVFAADVDWDAGQICLTGRMRQAALFHERLTLTRAIVSPVGGCSLEINDTVANEGYEPVELRLMYHFNFGWPLLSPAARLRVESPTPEPWTDDARRGQDRWDRFEEPTSPRPEEVFFHAPRPDEHGWATARLTNGEAGFGMALNWDTAYLPHMVQWKSMQAGDYALGLEPATNRIDRAETPPLLLPGERRVFRLRLEAFPL